MLEMPSRRTVFSFSVNDRRREPEKTYLSRVVPVISVMLSQSSSYILALGILTLSEKDTYMA